MLDAAPAHIGDVEETIETVEIDERTEIGDVLHAALLDLVLLERGEQLGLLLGHRALDELTTRNDEVTTLVGNLDDLEIEGLTDVGLELLDRGDLDLAAREERLDIVDRDEKTAADGALDRTGNDTTLDITLQDLLPADLVVSGLLGKADRARLVILELAEENRDLVTDLHLGIAELAGVNTTGGLVTDVDVNVIILDGADRALDEATGLERGLLTRLGEHFRHRGRTLRRSRRLANCHYFASLLGLLMIAVFCRVRPEFERGNISISLFWLVRQWGKVSFLPPPSTQKSASPSRPISSDDDRCHKCPQPIRRTSPNS